MEPEQLLKKVRDVCQQLDLTYLIVGSTATIAYGEPRFTNDIDVALALPARKVVAFCECFPASDYYLSEMAVAEAVEQQSQFNLIHPTSGLKVDFIVLTDSEFDQSRLRRKRDLPVFEEGSACFASPEDVILKKMVYHREGGSDKHLRDIAGVLRIQGDRLEREYIGTWADKLGVGDIWRAVLAKEAAG